MSTFLQPQVSFIVPVYNSAKHLDKCLESILAQSIEKEIICIDDGSNDNSLNILLFYARQYPFITIIHSNQNNGQSNARNKGLDLAKGEYIYFVDSDDILINNHFPFILESFQHINCDIIKLQTYLQYDDLCVRREPFLNKVIMDGESTLLDMREFLIQMERRRWIPSICWSLIRRSFLEKHHVRFIEGVKTEDQLFYLQLLTVDPSAKIIELDLASYVYVRHQNTTTTTQANLQYLLDHFTMAQYIIEWIVNYKNEIFYSQMLYILKSLYIGAYQYLETFPKEKQEQYYHLFTDEIIKFINNENI